MVHFAVTVEGVGAGQVKVYLNGGAPFLYPGNPGVTSQRFWIGNSQNGAWLDGNAAEVKVYDAVLTRTEIQQEMNQFAPVRAANPNSFYALQAAQFHSPNRLRRRSGIFNGERSDTGFSLIHLMGRPAALALLVPENAPP